MADDKWISGLDGDMTITEAARRILTVRLSTVLDRLPAAVDQAIEDIEHVHQLRVGTRRAGAAVQTFADYITSKFHKRARRTLRAIRRAAGAARDWDVFLQTVNARLARTGPQQQAGLDFLLGFGHGQRVCAQEHLRDATDGKAAKLHQLLGDLEESLDVPAHAGTLRDLAVPMVTQLLKEFEQAASGDLHAYEALHQVRILGKQLRYAMELFESCFHHAFREEIYTSVTEMQDILGKSNDSHVATGRLEDLTARLERTQPDQWPRYRPAVQQLQLYHRRRLPSQRRLFLKWWAQWQSSGLSATLGKLLKT
jgi:CHAD domain-containing protein